jgi:DNA-binding response OmpR family regulator
MNKILIIDDDRELCALIKRSVQAENIEADFCNTGKEGLQKGVSACSAGCDDARYGWL